MQFVVRTCICMGIIGTIGSCARPFCTVYGHVVIVALPALKVNGSFGIGTPAIGLPRESWPSVVKVAFSVTVWLLPVVKMLLG